MATAKTKAKDALDTAATAAADTAKSATDTAKAGIDRVKDALPSMDRVASDVQDYVQTHANVDLQQFADDATDFVRRNPATSLAAAAGVGILIGLLASKRS